MKIIITHGSGGPGTAEWNTCILKKWDMMLMLKITLLILI